MWVKLNEKVRSRRCVFIDNSKFNGYGWFRLRRCGEVVFRVKFVVFIEVGCGVE